MSPTQEPSEREGPKTRVSRSCQGCKHAHAEYYAIQGDSGYEYLCMHPAMPEPKHFDGWRTPDWCPVLAQASEKQDEVKALQAEATTLKGEVADLRRQFDGEIKALRRLLWLNHGHKGLYGDDGEMQCPVCRLDFKCDPIALIEERFAPPITVPCPQCAEHPEWRNRYIKTGSCGLCSFGRCSPLAEAMYWEGLREAWTPRREVRLEAVPAPTPELTLDGMFESFKELVTGKAR